VHTPDTQPKLILSLAEAADLLGLRPSQVYGLTRNRSRCHQRIPLPFLRLGRRRLAFRRESLEKWIVQLESEAAEVR
jgi:predicted DNA-binding transcriptional regulator AlpA